MRSKILRSLACGLFIVSMSALLRANRDADRRNERIPVGHKMHVPLHKAALMPFGTPGPNGFTPQQLRHAYGFDQLGTTGQGQVIAIVNAYGSSTIQADLNTFCAQFSLPGTNVAIYYPQGKPGTDPLYPEWANETSLDVEWAHAIAPGATIDLVVARSSSTSDLLGAVDYAASLGANQVSMSWGGVEYSTERGSDFHFNVPEVTFFASSGDHGAYALGVNGLLGVSYPASSPYVVGVGGTTLSLNSSNEISSETAWSYNSGTVEGSGGGISLYETVPGYQAGWWNGSGRGVPDVAYDGNPSTGVPIYVTGFEWQQFGGTSMSAPQWAALCALANSLRSQPIGSAPGILYTLATANYAGYYHDITSGSDGAYAAGPGYDLVTGLGSPMANQLVIALAGGFNSQVAAPVFFPPAGSYASSQNVTLVSATPGASIRYTTDGSTPTDTSGALYSAPVPISANTTLTAIAFAGGLTDSPVANGAYTFLPQVATPTFSPVAGSYTSVQSVSIATTTPGASLRYTTDGSTPTEAIGLPYTGPVSIASATTINAVAYETGYIDSVVASGAYLFPPAAAPAFNPMAGTYLTTQSVAISSATGGASIRYTTDGSTPTETSGTLYSVPVSIGVNTTLKALAYEMAFADSPVASGGYVIGTGNGTLTGSSGGGFFAEALPSAQAGSFTVAFDAAPSVSPENAVVGLSKGGATAYGNLSCIARFNPFGDIDAYNGTAYGPSTVPYSAGVSYHFRFVVNVPAHTYSVYVTPAGGSELTVGLNYVFRSTASVSSLDTWNLEVDATPTGCALQAGNLSLVSSGGGLVAAPTFSPSPGTYATAQMVTISSTTGGASIRYTTDGSTPTESHGTLYSGAPISVANSTALNTVAYEAGYTDSPVIGGVYIIGNSPPPQVVAPLFSPAAGTYASAQMVTITPTTFGSITRYTTDGTIPTETSGTIYFGAPVNIGRTTTLNAISYETGYSDSPVSKGIYTILSQAIPPSFTPAGGTYNSAQTVTISSLTNGSTIAYTLDGSTPAESNGNVTNGTSLPNNGSVFIDASAKLRAMAFVSGYADSMVVTAFYTIDTPIPTAPRIRGSNGNRTPTNRTRRPE